MSTAAGGLDAFERLVYARYACGRFDPNRPVPDELLTRLCVLTQVSARGRRPIAARRLGLPSRPR